MVDTLDIAKRLQANGAFTPEQAEGIATAVAQASNDKQLGEIETRLRLHDWMLGIIVVIGLGLLWQSINLGNRLAANEERLASFQQEANRRLSTIESKLDQLLARP